MSQAFVKESDEQWLHDVPPSINALIIYLTRENNGIRVYEQKRLIDEKTSHTVHFMSNGLSYAKDEKGKFVYTVNGNLAQRKEITTGIEENSRVEILSGVAGSDTVITTGAQFVKDGSQVTIQQ